MLTEPPADTHLLTHMLTFSPTDNLTNQLSLADLPPDIPATNQLIGWHSYLLTHSQLLTCLSTVDSNLLKPSPCWHPHLLTSSSTAFPSSWRPASPTRSRSQLTLRLTPDHPRWYLYLPRPSSSLYFVPVTSSPPDIHWNLICWLLHPLTIGWHNRLTTEMLMAVHDEMQFHQNGIPRVNLQWPFLCEETICQNF